MRKSPIPVIAAICILVSCHSAPAASDPLIDALDLNRPDLAAVKHASEQGNLDQARAAFAQHLRQRNTPKWYFDPAHPPTDLPDAERQSADAAMKHLLFSITKPYQFGEKIDWTFNPTTQPGSEVAVNHEWTWQLNRHPFWASLAKAYNATGDARYARELSAQITDWTTANPMPPKADQAPGSRWRTIEAGIRMSTSWPEVFYRMVRSPDFPDETLLAMVEAMRQHGEYLEAWFTGGNWMTMESNGLFHAGALFPEFKNAAKWRHDALERQRKELDVQVYPDGSQKELAPGYHNVALRNFTQTLQLARINDIPTPPGYQAALEKMYALNQWLSLPDRAFPPFNDSARTDARPFLETGLKLFPQRTDWQWIVSDGKTGQQPAQNSYFFPWAGWTVMRSGWDRDARCLIMEGGPFGAGHQHEDKLSFILDAYGSPLLVEAGIFTYDKSRMRNYVLTARGHNVIHADGLEQNRGAGPKEFWVRKQPAAMKWTTTEKFDYTEASYGEEPDERWGRNLLTNILHTRRIIFVKPDYWIVIDTLKPKDDQEHQYDSTFHLNAPKVSVDPQTMMVTTLNQTANLAIVPLKTPGLNVHVIEGQTDPQYQGWIAETPYRLEPRPTPYFTQRGVGEMTFLYALVPGANR